MDQQQDTLANVKAHLLSKDDSAATLRTQIAGQHLVPNDSQYTINILQNKPAAAEPAATNLQNFGTAVSLLPIYSPDEQGQLQQNKSLFKLTIARNQSPNVAAMEKQQPHTLREMPSTKSIFKNKRYTVQPMGAHHAQRMERRRRSAVDNLRLDGITGQKTGQKVMVQNVHYGSKIALPSILRRTEEMLHQMENKRRKETIVDQLMQDGDGGDYHDQLMPTSQSKVLMNNDDSAAVKNSAADSRTGSQKTLINDLRKQHRSKQQLSEIIKAKNERIAKEIKVEGFQNHLFHNSDLTHSLPFGIHDPLFKYSFLQKQDSDDEDVQRDQQANRVVAY